MYKGIKFRSTWEVVFAMHLDKCGIEWSYEPTAFETPFGFYTPDFYVPVENKYYEVKGIFRDKNAKDKFTFFSEKYSTVLVDKDFLKGIGIKDPNHLYRRFKYGTEVVL